MEDKRIIELYFARDEQAIRHTADKYGAYCTAVSMSILHSEPDAEECVNDTYLKTWNSIPPTRPSSLKLFLARITRNLSINRHRALHSDKRNKDLEVSLSELESCFPSPDDTLWSVAKRYHAPMAMLTVANDLPAAEPDDKNALDGIGYLIV